MSTGKINSVKSFFSRLVPREVKYDKKLEIYTNGFDNLYPDETERLIGASISATMATRLMVQYIVGRGFGVEFDKKEINSNNESLIKIGRKIARSLTKHRGVFVQIEYGISVDSNDLENPIIEPVGFNYLPFHHCRIGKKDSKEYNGKVLVCKNWADAKKEHITSIDVYNPRAEVVRAQIEECRGNTILEKLANYNGQVIYLNLDDEYYYPVARIDTVREECDSERQAGIFRNTGFRRGFLGKQIMITRPLVDNDLIERARTIEAPKEALVELREAESERQAFRDNADGFLGAENYGGFMHVEIDFSGEKLEDAVVFKSVDSNLDDRMFEYSEDKASDKILMAFNNLPKVLLTSKDNSMFGQSGALLKEAKKSYWESCTEDRNAFAELMNELAKIIGLETTLVVQPLLREEVSEDSAQIENQKAQAVLRGSVGGVTALIQLATAVSQGQVDFAGAVKIIETIYGVDVDTARAMLGTPPAAKPPVNA